MAPREDVRRVGVIVPNGRGEGRVAGIRTGGGLSPRRASVTLRRVGETLFIAIVTIGFAALLLGWADLVASLRP